MNKEQSIANRIMAQMSNSEVNGPAYNVLNTFAVSANKWATGHIVLTGEGGLIYDPKSDGSSIFDLFKAAGKIEVSFEGLIVHLANSGIKFNSKELAAEPISSSPLQQLEREQYFKTCADLGHSIVAKLLAETE
ncbi:hypothetical protein QWZ04_23300 [Vibrio tapetis subsp. quintayensis]|uniref:hypothetical protein n=1 Tax=Vibrio tapetis TaxID=52443 RepID=UPI0025B48668|nr:hypothetical protein [Vibrio tapetis]MDN3683236.1 hypothetical protein [Vibrio tapetis subsp. quintayensis]